MTRNSKDENDDVRSVEGPLFPDHTADKAKGEAPVEVPEDLSAAETLDWVSNDKARAEAALKSEKKSGDGARGSLVQSLERIVNEDTGAGVASGEV